MARVTPGTILLAFVAILCGLLGAFMVTRPRDAEAAAAAEKKSPDKIIVPVASTNLQTGREITLGDIALLRLSRAEIKKRGLKSPFMASTQQIIGRVVQHPLLMGATFRTDDLFPEGLGPGVDELLEAGYRAVTISVAGDNALLGFASAGSWVDVIFRSDSSTDREPAYDQSVSNPAARAMQEDITLTLLDRVRVLALGKNTVSGAHKNQHSLDSEMAVTLAVTPAQAEKLRVVEDRGELSLVLRRADDLASQTATAPRTLSDVLNRRDTTHTMEIFRGTQVERILYRVNEDGWAGRREASQPAGRRSDVANSGNGPMNSH